MLKFFGECIIFALFIAANIVLQVPINHCKQIFKLDIVIS